MRTRSRFLGTAEGLGCGEQTSQLSANAESARLSEALVPALPQKPVDLRFSYVVEHHCSTLFAFILFDVPKHLVERNLYVFRFARFGFRPSHRIDPALGVLLLSSF